MTRQARQELLLQANQSSERPDLPAVRVSRQLQVDPESGGVEHRSGLVRKQNQRALLVAAAERLLQIFAMAFLVESRRRTIVNARQIEDGAVFTNRNAFVAQRKITNPKTRLMFGLICHVHADDQAFVSIKCALYLRIIWREVKIAF